METTVVNLNDYVAPQFGSGRLIKIDRTTKWGNPFRIGQDGDRAGVIEKYRQWLWRKIQQEEINLYELADLHGCELGCHCHPLPCHGDGLAQRRARVGSRLPRRHAQRSEARRSRLRAAPIRLFPRLRTTEPLAEKPGWKTQSLKGVNDDCHRDTRPQGEHHARAHRARSTE